MKVRFPNESVAVEVESFDVTDFQLKESYKNEVFGWWNNLYVGVNREEYEKALGNTGS